MRTIAARVALAAALSSALAGAIVAVVGVWLTDTLAREREDARLLDAAGTLAIELDEPGASVAWVVADETRELAATGIHVAVYRGASLVAGELGEPPAPGTCASARGERVCAVSATDGHTALAARSEAVHTEHRTTSMLASALAVLFTSLLGALVAGRVARWSISPLAQLTQRVAAVEAEHVSPSDLGPPTGVAEVDALRGALEHALGRLASALSSARRFAADAAHELRTPLTTMRAELELLAESHAAAERLDPQAIERVKRTAERLGTLVERLLVLARPLAALEASELVHVEDLLDELVGELPEPSRARVTTHIDRDLSVVGDAALLRAMIGSGLENALKFSADAVVVRGTLIGDGVQLDIDDAGPGIPHEERRALFDAFRRSPSARSRGIPGHGIGLSLVAHVAALHGGRASFEDGAKGARLRITLPAA